VSAERVAMIRERLESALCPVELEVIDESHLHVGHAGARDGRGHFRARVVSCAFESMSRLERHREVYGAMGEMMTTDIHALNIEALTPDER